MLLLGSGPGAAGAAIRAQRLGCQVTLAQAAPGQARSSVTASLQAAGVELGPCWSTTPRHGPDVAANASAATIRALRTLMADSDVVGLLPGAAPALAHPSFQGRSTRREQVWVVSGSARALPPAPADLVVVTEPLSPVVTASQTPPGHLARLTSYARSTVPPDGSVAMWLHSGGFLLFEPGRTSLVPCTPPRPPAVPPTTEEVTALVASMLDADLDIVGALEAATWELSTASLEDPADPSVRIREAVDAAR
jgi:hypothetical protein